MICCVAAGRMHNNHSVACIRAVDKQRGLPPGSCTAVANCGEFALLFGEHRRDRGDVGDGVLRKRFPCCEVLFVPRRTGMVGRKEACRSEAIVHLLQIRGASHNVVVRIEGIETQLIASAELNPSARHKLHQAECAAGRRRAMVASALNLHHGTDPACRDGETSGCFRDEFGEAIDGLGTRRSLCAQVGFKGSQGGHLAHEWRDGHDEACNYPARTEPYKWACPCGCIALPLRKVRKFRFFWTAPVRKDQSVLGGVAISRGSGVALHDHSSSVHTGTALPITADAGIGPKYRPSSESADCQFMTKTSPSAITRHPRQTGSGRPFPSRSCAFPTSMPSTEIVRPFLQTVCPGNANTRLSMGTPIGR